MSGGRLGKYTLGQQVGAGGFGSVFQAFAPDGSEVALKVLTSEVTPETLARFDQEVRLQKSFGAGGGFVPVLDSGIAQGVPYLVMPLLRGGTLADHLARGPLDVEATLALGLTLSESLARAHACGVVHRDLKPANILSGPQGSPLIADLGVAKFFRRAEGAGGQSLGLSRAKESRGTYAYMPPEQFADARSVGPPADVFALGVVLYECLAGESPFPSDSIHARLAAALAGRIKPLKTLCPAAPGWLCQTVERALSPAPEARPTADQLRDAFASRTPPLPSTHSPGLEPRASILSRVRSWVLPMEKIEFFFKGFGFVGLVLGPTILVAQFPLTQLITPAFNLQAPDRFRTHFLPALLILAAGVLLEAIYAGLFLRWNPFRLLIATLGGVATILGAVFTLLHLSAYGPLGVVACGMATNTLLHPEVSAKCHRSLKEAWLARGEDLREELQVVAILVAFFLGLMVALVCVALLVGMALGRSEGQ